MRITLAFTLVIWAVFSAPQPLYADSPPERIPDLSLDRADQNIVWRLSDHVQTADNPAPENANPVYLQFGFMGCEPCERLAVIANESFADANVTRVYVHLDDVLMSEGSRPRAIWKKLFQFAQTEPYQDFITVRRGNIPLMESLCGESAAVPSALLIRPDGVFEVLHAPEEAVARERFQTFLENLSADPKETR